MWKGQPREPAKSLCARSVQSTNMSTPTRQTSASGWKIKYLSTKSTHNYFVHSDFPRGKSVGCLFFAAFQPSALEGSGCFRALTTARRRRTYIQSLLLEKPIQSRMKHLVRLGVAEMLRADWRDNDGVSESLLWRVIAVRTQTDIAKGTGRSPSSRAGELKVGC